LDEVKLREIEQRKLSPRNSVIGFFVVGGMLLVIPFTLVMVWGSSICSPAQTLSAGPPLYCPSPVVFKSFISFFPFLMVIGGVLIGYNLKRISDSLLPPKEERDEANTEIQSF
jgi:hypothetical protein